MAEIFFLVVLMGVGGRILYEDFRIGRIRNNLILILIGAGIFLNYYAGTFANQLLPYLINICFGILAGLIIWLAGLWSAADAKLYISLVVLFPVIWFRPSPGYFPGFAILLNSTVPLFLFLTAQVLVQSNWREKIQAATKISKLPFLLNIFAVSTGAILLRSLMADFFKIKLDYFLTLPLFLGIFWSAGKLKIKIIYLFISIIIFSFIFFPQLIGLRFFLTVFIFSSLILFTFWIISLSQPRLTQEVKIVELKEGMILGEMILIKNQRLVKQPLAFLTFLTSLAQRIRSKPIFGYNPDGLKISEIKELQEMEKAGRLEFETIRIAKTLPFAPALFSGILITYFLKGSLFIIV